jgi:hypothetical protein
VCLKLGVSSAFEEWEEEEAEAEEEDLFVFNDTTRKFCVACAFGVAYIYSRGFI